jgi:hypothetical protein
MFDMSCLNDNWKSLLACKASHGLLMKQVMALFLGQAK